MLLAPSRTTAFIYSATTERSTGIICDQTIALDGFYAKKDYPQHLRRIRFKDQETGKTLVFLTNNFTLLSGVNDLRSLQKSLAGRIVLQMDQATSAHQTVLWYVRKCYQIANLDRCLGLCAGSHHKKTTQAEYFALHFVTNFIRHCFRENPHTASLAGRRIQIRRTTCV